MKAAKTLKKVYEESLETALVNIHAHFIKTEIWQQYKTVFMSLFLRKGEADNFLLRFWLLPFYLKIIQL